MRYNWNENQKFCGEKWCALSFPLTPNTQPRMPAHPKRVFRWNSHSFPTKSSLISKNKVRAKGKSRIWLGEMVRSRFPPRYKNATSALPFPLASVTQPRILHTVRSDCRWNERTSSAESSRKRKNGGANGRVIQQFSGNRPFSQGPSWVLGSLFLLPILRFLITKTSTTGSSQKSFYQLYCENE